MFKKEEFKNEIEDKLINMYKMSLEVEMHINALLSMNEIIEKRGLNAKEQYVNMNFYHNTLSVLLASFILKTNPKVLQDEEPSLCALRRDFLKKGVDVNKSSVKCVFDNIVGFYKNKILTTNKNV